MVWFNIERAAKEPRNIQNHRSVELDSLRLDCSHLVARFHGWASNLGADPLLPCQLEFKVWAPIVGIGYALGAMCAPD